MIQIYTTPSCSSCRKAKKWLEQHQIEYKEKNIFNIQLSRDDIMMMLKNTENGFEDIISTRSKIFQELNIDIEEMPMNDMIDFVIENPSVLRRPIIIEDAKMQVGYNEDEIRTFIPKRLREIIMTTSSDHGEDSDYLYALKLYMDEIDS